MAAEQTVRIDSSTPVSIAVSGQPISTTVVTSAAAPIFTTNVLDPGITGVYVTSLPDIPGVVAANNFVSLFNPVGSGKMISVFSATVSSYLVTGGTNVRASLLATRITAASGGTLLPASSIAKSKSSYADPAAQVRTGNPTVTFTSNVIAFPPPVGADTAGSSDRVVAATGASVICAPGEGLAFHTASGDINQTWNISFAWGEG